jgi:hypothetical protein
MARQFPPPITNKTLIPFALLYEEDTETFHDQLNQLIEKIENAEKKFFKLKYLTEFPDQASMMAEEQASMMAEMACKITDDQGQLNTDKLGSLVQHWSAHPSSWGETNENYIEILKQIVQILGTFPTPPQATVANTRNNIFYRKNTGMSGNTGMTTSREDDGENADGAKKRGP